ncbi:unnamed protein product [Arabidopsis halleri]
MDLKTRKIIISRHVLFDETKFPAAELAQTPDSYGFLEACDDPSPLFKSFLQTPFPTEPQPQAQSRATTRSTHSDPMFHAPPPMKTRSQSGITKPRKIMSLVAQTQSPLPKSHIQALSDPNWNPAMNDENGAMLKTKTWDLVPRPPNVNIMGFITSKADASLFIFRRNNDFAYLLLYVDDIILTASSNALLHRVISALKSEFPMTDLGKLKHFLGVKAEFNDKGLFLSQSLYAQEILERAGMSDCKPIATPVDLKSKLSSSIGEPVKDPTFYRSLAGALQYLTFTQLTWLRNLMTELHRPLHKASIVYCDNISSVYLSTNPVKHQRTKHIELDIHFVREKVAIGQVRVIHVPSSLQYADIFTKGLPSSLHNEFRSSLTVRTPHATTAGG